MYLRKNSALMNKLMDVDRNTKLDVVGDILSLLEACVVPLVIIILYKYIPTSCHIKSI